MFVLVDHINTVYWGPFKTEEDAKRYAKLNDWGTDGWSVEDLNPPTADADALYRVVME